MSQVTRARTGKNLSPVASGTACRKSASKAPLDNDAAPVKCKKCRKIVSNADDALQCDEWVHIRCDKISKEAYHILGNKKAGHMWICALCKPEVKKESKIGRIKHAEYISRLEKQLEKIKKPKGQEDFDLIINIEDQQKSILRDDLGRDSLIAAKNIEIERMKAKMEDMENEILNLNTIMQELQSHIRHLDCNKIETKDVNENCIENLPAGEVTIHHSEGILHSDINENKIAKNNKIDISIKNIMPHNTPKRKKNESVKQKSTGGISKINKISRSGNDAKFSAERLDDLNLHFSERLKEKVSNDNRSNLYLIGDSQIRRMIPAHGERIICIPGGGLDDILWNAARCCNRLEPNGFLIIEITGNSVMEFKPEEYINIIESFYTYVKRYFPKLNLAFISIFPRRYAGGNYEYRRNNINRKLRELGNKLDFGVLDIAVSWKYWCRIVGFGGIHLNYMGGRAFVETLEEWTGLKKKGYEKLEIEESLEMAIIQRENSIPVYRRNRNTQSGRFSKKNRYTSNSNYIPVANKDGIFNKK